MTSKDKPLRTVMFSLHSLSPHPLLINTNTHIQSTNSFAFYPPSNENEWDKSERKTWTQQSLAQLTATGNA